MRPTIPFLPSYLPQTSLFLLLNRCAALYTCSSSPFHVSIMNNSLNIRLPLYFFFIHKNTRHAWINQSEEKTYFQNIFHAFSSAATRFSSYSSVNIYFIYTLYIYIHNNILYSRSYKKKHENINRLIVWRLVAVVVYSGNDQWTIMDNMETHTHTLSLNISNTLTHTHARSGMSCWWHDICWIITQLTTCFFTAE